MVVLECNQRHLVFTIPVVVAFGKKESLGIFLSAPPRRCFHDNRVITKGLQHNCELCLQLTYHSAGFIFNSKPTCLCRDLFQSQCARIKVLSSSIFLITNSEIGITPLTKTTCITCIDRIKLFGVITSPSIATVALRDDTQNTSESVILPKLWTAR